MDVTFQGIDRLANELATNPQLAKEFEQVMAESKAAGNMEKPAGIFSRFAERHGYLQPILQPPVSQDRSWVKRTDEKRTFVFTALKRNATVAEQMHLRCLYCCGEPSETQHF